MSKWFCCRGWGIQSVLLGPDDSLLPAGNLVVVENSQCGVDDDETKMCAKNEFFLFEKCTADPGGEELIQFNASNCHSNFIIFFCSGSLTTRVFNVEVQDVLIGVVPAAKSTSSGCPTASSIDPTLARPAAYTRLGPHYNWLLDVTRGTTHCVPSKIFRNHYKQKLVAANRVEER